MSSGNVEFIIQMKINKKGINLHQTHLHNSAGLFIKVPIPNLFNKSFYAWRRPNFVC